MATTSQQDRDFLSAVIDSRLLESEVDWIASNMEPGDVFSRKQLESWAESNGYEESDE